MTTDDSGKINTDANRNAINSLNVTYEPIDRRSKARNVNEALDELYGIVRKHEEILEPKVFKNGDKITFKHFLKEVSSKTILGILILEDSSDIISGTSKLIGSFFNDTHTHTVFVLRNPLDGKSWSGSLNRETDKISIYSNNSEIVDIM